MKIGEIRAIRSDALISGMASNTVVYVLLQADRLTVQAANALLKVLEEPPPGVVFGLMVTRPSRLPVTVLSRCQHIRLPRTGLARIEDDETREGAEALAQLLAEARIETFDQAFAKFSRWRFKRDEAMGTLEALAVSMREQWRAGRCPQALLEAIEETKAYLQKNVNMALAFDNLYVRAAAIPQGERRWATATRAEGSPAGRRLGRAEGRASKGKKS